MSEPYQQRPLPILAREEIGKLKPALADVIEYRKSGLSLNWIIGCPLDCGYCIRHTFGNFEMKIPRRLMSDEEAVTTLVEHPYFRPHTTPLQLLNRATDPMLPAVKPHLFTVLRHLDARGLTNHVLVITRWRVDAEDCAVLNSFENLRLTVLVTHSGIDHEAIEPVDSQIAAQSLHTLYEHAERYRTILYWRPIVPGLNDSDAHLERARELSRHTHATVFTGLFYRQEIAAYYQAHGLPYALRGHRPAQNPSRSGRAAGAQCLPHRGGRLRAVGSVVPQDELWRGLRPRRGRLQRPLRRPRAVRHLPGKAARSVPSGLDQARSRGRHRKRPSPWRDRTR